MTETVLNFAIILAAMVLWLPRQQFLKELRHQWFGTQLQEHLQVTEVHTLEFHGELAFGEVRCLVLILFCSHQIGHVLS